MTAQDPKPARRIPDEGLFTVHFKNVGRGQRAFDAQVACVSNATIIRALRKRHRMAWPTINVNMPKDDIDGIVSTAIAIICTFTITPPTLKGDPDEPT